MAEDKGGAIPGNVIDVEQSGYADMFRCGNNESNSAYIKQSKDLSRKIHPARFPAELPKFFIEFLTESGDLVLDPFAGSNTTGAVAEDLGRKWIAIEKNREYANDSLLRFQAPEPLNANGRNGSKQGGLFDQLDVKKKKAYRQKA